MGDAVLQREGHRDIALNERQLAAELRQFRTSLQLLAHGSADFLDMLIDAVDGSVFLQQSDAGLFAYAFHARNIVGTVAHQALQLDQLPGLQTVMIAEGSQVPDDVLLAAFGQLHADLLRQQLQDVPVAGDDADLDVLFFDQAHHGADDVVGLVTLQSQHRNVESLYHFLDALDLRAQVIGHLFARALVLAEHGVTAAQAAVQADG